jgi:glycosyltransferase involved in cell wall biosynthesis
MVFCSIITVVFNNLSGLQKTWESIKIQSDSDWEWLVIDGGSTDGTPAYFESLKGTDSRITFISEKDNGLYDAMNKGIRLAKGKYVWFVNSGDLIFDSSILSKLRELTVDSDVFFGETMYINDKGDAIGIRSDVSSRQLPEKLTKYSMLSGMVVCHQSFIVKKSIVSEYNPNYKISADIDWVLHCLEKAQLITNTKLILSKYLVGGISDRHRKNAWKERWNVYVQHFGYTLTIFAHFWITIKYIWWHKINDRKY